MTKEQRDDARLRIERARQRHRDAQRVGRAGDDRPGVVAVPAQHRRVGIVEEVAARAKAGQRTGEPLPLRLRIGTGRTTSGASQRSIARTCSMRTCSSTSNSGSGSMPGRASWAINRPMAERRSAAPAGNSAEPLPAGSRVANARENRVRSNAHGSLSIAEGASARRRAPAGSALLHAAAPRGTNGGLRPTGGAPSVGPLLRPISPVGA